MKLHKKLLSSRPTPLKRSQSTDAKTMLSQIKVQGKMLSPNEISILISTPLDFSGDLYQPLVKELSELKLDQAGLALQACSKNKTDPLSEAICTGNKFLILLFLARNHEILNSQRPVVESTQVLYLISNPIKCLLSDSAPIFKQLLRCEDFRDALILYNEKY